MVKKTIISIVFCVESGLLETQARLLVESIMRLPNAKHYQLIAFSPRANSQPSQETITFFKRNHVVHLTEPINQKYQDYPIANKVLACAYVERQIESRHSILFVDTDTVFINDISEDCIKSEGFVYVRPVDNKGPGTLGVGDANDPFWKEVYQLFDLPMSDVSVITTVNNEKIRSYYNAGFIWSHKVVGFYEQWLQDFETLVQSKLRPFGYKSRDNTNFRCLDQVALAVTTSRNQFNTKELSRKYNYPIPFKPKIDQGEHHVDIEELIHVHYHKWFQHAGFLSHVCSEREKQSEVYAWLDSRLPIKPEIVGEFKC